MTHGFYGSPYSRAKSRSLSSGSTFLTFLKARSNLRPLPRAARFSRYSPAASAEILSPQQQEH